MENWVILQYGPALGLGNYTFANSPSHISAHLPLDVDLMAQIEVSIVCMKILKHLPCRHFLEQLLCIVCVDAPYGPTSL